MAFTYGSLRYFAGSSDVGPTTEGAFQYYVPAGTPYYERIDEYMSVKNALFYPITEPLRPSEWHLKCAHYIASHPTEQVCQLASQGDAKSMLELAVRLATGCAAPVGIDYNTRINQIFPIIHALFAPGAESRLTNFTPCVRRRALSFNAVFCRDGFALENRVLSSRAQLEGPVLSRAVSDANAAVEAGLCSRGVMDVACYVYNMGRNLGIEDIRRDPHFERFRALWEASDKYQAKLEKVADTQRRYGCAAPNCGFRTLRAKDLRQCAGSCDPAVKPSYCSKECQRADWPRHKSVCSSKTEAQDTTA